MDETDELPTGAVSAEEAGGDAVMGLLHDRVPLSLLLDLADGQVNSRALLEAEGMPDGCWWQTGPEA